MKQTLYCQSHWNGESWIHVHVYITNQEKRLSIYGLETPLSTSSFLSMCSLGDKTYIYDYGMNCLYECSVYDPRMSEASFSMDLHAIRLTKYLMLKQLRTKLFAPKGVDSTVDRSYLSSPQKSPIPFFKFMRNLNTLQPYSHLKSRQQQQRASGNAIVSAAICAINPTTIVVLSVQRKFLHGQDAPIYENYLLKLDLACNTSEHIKLRSQFERVNSMTFCNSNIFIVVEQSIARAKTEDELQDDAQWAEELAKLQKKLSKLDPEDDEYKALKPYHRPQIKPFEQYYQLCKIDMATFSVETILQKRIFIKIFVSEEEPDMLLILTPSYDLSSTITMASYKSTDGKLSLFHPKIASNLPLDEMWLAASYLQNNILMNPMSPLEISLSTEELTMRAQPSDNQVDP